MKLTKQKWLAAALVVMLVLALIPMHAFGAAVPAAKVAMKSSKAELVFDGQTVKLPAGQYLIIYKSRTYVPIRFVSNMLNKAVDWDPDTSTVIITEPTKKEEVALKEFMMNAKTASGTLASPVGVELQMTPREVKFLYNGEESLLPEGQIGYITNQRLYVPVRFVAELVGHEIDWDPDLRQVIGMSQQYLESLENGGNSGGTKPGTSTGGGNNGSTGSNGGSNGGSNNGGTGGDNGGTTNPGTGGGGGVVPSKPSYESIVAGAQTRLEALESSCMSAIVDIGTKILAAESDTARQSLVSQAKAKQADCDTNFEKLMNEIQGQLTSNGYSTAVIAEYRQYYAEQIEKLRALAKSLAPDLVF